MMMAPPLARPPPTRYPLWKFEGCILGGPRNAPVGMPSSARDPSLSVFFFFFSLFLSFLLFSFLLDLLCSHGFSPVPPPCFPFLSSLFFSPFLCLISFFACGSRTMTLFVCDTRKQADAVQVSVGR